jgi:hypothetical protein
VGVLGGLAPCFLEEMLTKGVEEVVEVLSDEAFQD